MSGDAIFCPACNARGSAQPVLSPMARIAVPRSLAAGAASRAVPEAHYLVTCPRCGYGEIDPRPAPEIPDPVAAYEDLPPSRGAERVPDATQWTPPAPDVFDRPSGEFLPPGATAGGDGAPELGGGG